MTPSDLRAAPDRPAAWEWLLPATLLAALLAWTFTLHSPKPGFDLYWFLHLGRTMVETGSIPHADSFLNTAPFLSPHYWLNDEWGFEWGAYETWRHLGFAGLALAKALGIGGMFTCLYLSCRRLGMGCVPACAWLLAVALVMEPRFTPRPHLVTDLCLSVLTWMLLRWERGAGPPAWATLPLFALWANVHAGVTTGVGILVIWGVGTALEPRARRDAGFARRLGVALASAVVGLLLSPQGAGMGRHLLEHTTNPSMGMIDEWAPVGSDWWRTGYGAFVWAACVGFGGTAWVRRREGGTRGPVRLSHLLVTVALAVAAARYNRVLNELCAVAAPLVGAALVEAWNGFRGGAWVDARPRAARLVRAGAALVLVALAGPALLRLPPPVSEYEPNERVLPSEAVRFIQSHAVPGRLYNTYHYGGYLLWAQVPPFIHGCPPLYGDALLHDYLDIAIGDDTTRTRLLARYDVRACLLDWRRHPRIFTGMIMSLSRDPGWRLVYWDDGAVLFVRAPGSVPGVPAGGPGGASGSASGAGGGSPLPEPYVAVNPALPDPFIGSDANRVRGELARKLAEDPDGLEARRLLAELALRTQDPAAAIRACDEVLVRAPEDSGGRWRRALARRASGDLAGALADARVAAAQAPDEPMPALVLGWVLCEVATKERQARSILAWRWHAWEAGRALARCLALDPGNEAARRLQQAVAALR